jgi:Tol biopolymer transport system component
MIRKKYGKRMFLLAGALVFLFFGQSSFAQQTAEDMFEAALLKKEAAGDLNGAIQLFQKILKEFPQNRDVCARALLQVGMCYEKLGNEEAQKAYQRIIHDYADQPKAVADARARLASLTLAGKSPGAALEGRTGFTFRKIDFPEVGYSHQARFSPDGKKMLYVGFQEKEPQYNLRVLDFASGKSLTLVEGFNADAATLLFDWSPDGKKVVYVAGRGELRLIGSDGGKSEPLWATPEKETSVRPLDWSGQNHSLLISLINQTENSVRLAMLPERGGAPRMVVSGRTDDLGYDSAHFSPDGKFIVGMKRIEKNTDIYAWNVEGGEETRITDHPAEDTYPLWSPDGKYIVFLSDRAKTVDLWAIAMAGSRRAGEPVRLQAGIGKNKIPTDLTQSGVLAFYAMSSAGTPSDLFVLPVDPQTGQAAGSFHPFADYPTQGSRWSPDGSRIAYTSRKGNIQLPNAYVNAGGNSEELEIPARGYWMGSIDWSRDGKSLLFEGWNSEDERAGIFRISLEDLKIEPVQPPGERVGTGWKGAYLNLRWLPLAGRYMFFKLVGGEGKEEIYMMDPKDYRIERVGEKTGMGGYSIPSPDGRFLISSNPKDKTINLLSVADDSSKVLSVLPSTGFPAFSWSPDGQSFVWNEGRELKLYSVLDGTARILVEARAGSAFGSGSLGNGTPNTSFSPDGTKIAYVLEVGAKGPGQRTELWIVEAKGGASKKIADAPSSHPNLGAVVWHPSGKMIFAGGQAAQGTRRMFEHWVMENFLPEKK